MNALEMISGPLLFVEHLHEHTQKVHQAVESIPLLVNALLAADHQQVGSLHEKMSRIKDQADRIKHSLYDEFADIHFRGAGRYALGEYIASMDKVAESAEAFADLLVCHKTTLPTELRADLQVYVSQVVQINDQILKLTEALWPPEEAVSTERQTRDVLDAIEKIVDSHREAQRLGMEFIRHLYALEGQLDPKILLYLNQCHTVLREAANNTAHAADLLRMVIQ